MICVLIRKFGHRMHTHRRTPYMCVDRRREWSDTSLKELQGFLTMAKSQGKTHGTNSPSELPDITPWFHTSGLQN